MSMLIKIRTLCVLILLIFSVPALAQDQDIYDLGIEELTNTSLKRPIILGLPHPHNKGEGMLSYSYMFMKMDQNLIGTSSVENSTILTDFMVTPVYMDMKMHMIMGMYTPVDRVTLMIMTSYSEYQMRWS